MDTPETLPECLRCGTCCFSQLETYVPVTGDDHARLGDAADALVTWIGNRAYMRMVDGHCAALRVEPDGKSERSSARSTPGARFVCTTYDTRPQTCRALERGSPACLGERDTKSDRPLLALRRARDGEPEQSSARSTHGA